MNTMSLQRLKSLTDLCGVPGQEEAVSAYLHDELAPYASRITYDALGSLIAEGKTLGEKKPLPLLPIWMR